MTCGRGRGRGRNKGGGGICEGDEQGAEDRGVESFIMPPRSSSIFQKSCFFDLAYVAFHSDTHSSPRQRRSTSGDKLPVIISVYDFYDFCSPAASSDMSPQPAVTL